MRLLLVNDDGVGAFGLNALAKRLSASHDITVVAPVREYSACSHQITIDRKISFKKIQTKPFDIYAVDGTPADCSRLGLLGLSKSFDLVITGINHGLNLGLDLYYSGTFSAAAEASLLGTKAIACSADLRKPSGTHEYATIVDWIADFIENEAVLLFQSTQSTVLNLNFPVPLDPLSKGVMCSLATSHYEHVFTIDEQGFECTIKIHEESAEPESDFAAHLKGNIAITLHNPHDGRR